MVCVIMFFDNQDVIKHGDLIVQISLKGMHVCV